MLADGELEFEPLLPDDDAPLEEQVQALALWCHGFLSGVGASAPDLEVRGERRMRTIRAARSPRSCATSPRSAARASSEDEDAGDRDTADFALAEIQEYVRVSVQIVFEDLGAVRPRPATRTSPTYTDDDEVRPVNAKEFARRRTASHGADRRERHRRARGGAGARAQPRYPVRLSPGQRLLLSDGLRASPRPSPCSCRAARRASSCCSAASAIPSASYGTGRAPAPTAPSRLTAPTTRSRSRILDDILPGLLERSDRVYYSIGGNEFDQKLLAFIQTLNSKRQSGHAPSELVALDHLLHEMRLFKSRAESERHAPGRAHRRRARIARAMRACRPGMKEYELEAEFVHEFRRHGAECSYPPIVAAGANACILHYRSNDAQLVDGDLVLIDAGCEFGMYASDVTRTFPVNGRVQHSRSASSTRSCSRRILRPRPRRRTSATTGTIRTTRPSASSRAA